MNINSSNMGIPFFQSDAFTSIPFKGNAAGVCLLQQELGGQTMQQIAMENNLAVTAFVLKQDDGFSLRWFTPTAELKLCGHGTLGTAHILWQEGLLAENQTARFYAGGSLLTAQKKGDWIELDFPLLESSPIELPEALARALGVKAVNTCFADRYIVELASEDEVRAAQPDFNVMKAYDGVVITSLAAAGSPYDFISRSFVPKHGVNEDPVTGSSHCALLPYWSAKLNKTTFFAYQASARGGELRLTAAGNRALLAGQAVTVLKGELFI